METSLPNFHKDISTIMNLVWDTNVLNTKAWRLSRSTVSSLTLIWGFECDICVCGYVYVVNAYTACA